MANKSAFKPSRMDLQRNRTHEAWREVVDAEDKARREKSERLAAARAVRDAEPAGAPSSEPKAAGTAKKSPRKK